MDEEIGMSKVNEVKNLWWDYVYAFDTKHTHIHTLYFTNSNKKWSKKELEMSTNFILNVDSRHHPPSHNTRPPQEKKRKMFLFIWA